MFLGYGARGVQHLQGQLAVQDGVLRQPHRALAAAAQLLQKRVGAEPAGSGAIVLDRVPDPQDLLALAAHIRTPRLRDAGAEVVDRDGLPLTLKADKLFDDQGDLVGISVQSRGAGLGGLGGIRCHR